MLRKQEELFASEGSMDDAVPYSLYDYYAEYAPRERSFAMQTEPALLVKDIALFREAYRPASADIASSSSGSENKDSIISIDISTEKAFESFRLSNINFADRHKRNNPSEKEAAQLGELDRYQSTLDRLVSIRDELEEIDCQLRCSNSRREEGESSSSSSGAAGPPKVHSVWERLQAEALRVKRESGQRLAAPEAEQRAESISERIALLERASAHHGATGSSASLFERVSLLDPMLLDSLKAQALELKADVAREKREKSARDARILAPECVPEIDRLFGKLAPHGDTMRQLPELILRFRSYEAQHVAAAAGVGRIIAQEAEAAAMAEDVEATARLLERLASNLGANEAIFDGNVAMLRR